MRDGARRARILAAVTEKGTQAGAGELVAGLCRLAVEEMALSGCALVLMSGPGSASMLAGAGRHASTVSGLQMELGEGPCLQAHASGIPVFLPDLTAGGANRWPAFAAAALAIGVQAEFSLPLTVLYQPYAAGGTSLSELLDTSGADRVVVHQATGMIAAQLDESMANALARLRGAAFASGRPMLDIAQDVVERRLRFDE